MATGTSLLTAEEYVALPDPFDGPTELLKGELVTMPPARPRHGEICFRVAYILGAYLETHPLGRMVTNDSSVLTERHPDSVRGVDVAYYSYERVPKGPLPKGLLSASPDLVFEVLSPSDRWSDMHTKIAELLNVGVRAVSVLDDDARTVHLFFADGQPEVLSGHGELSFPDVLGDFRVPINRFFE